MQTIRLSTVPGGVNAGVNLSQYDVGRQIKFLLFDDIGAYTPEAGSTVKIRATKPSGFGFDVACTWNQNEVTATVTDDMSSEAGSFEAELRITKDDEILGTANFLWNVEKSTHLEGTVDGNTEARGLLQDLQDAAEAAQDAAGDAQEAAGIAWQAAGSAVGVLDSYYREGVVKLYIRGDGQGEIPMAQGVDF